MKISASIYSNRDRPLEDQIRELDQYGIDAFHVDCNDDLSVFEDIRRIKQISKTPVDLHVISSEPEKFIEGIQKHQVDWVTFQLENLAELPDLSGLSKVQLGIAIVDSTPVSAFEPYADLCDFILLMTTTPGKSGGSFSTNTFSKIRSFRQLYPGKRIHVDGGVNNEVSFILRDMGVYSCVSGSYLMNHEHIGSALYSLKTQETPSHFRIGDFMIPKVELPVLPETNTSFAQAVTLMDQYKMGFIFFEASNGKLAGICSNADLRKGIVKNLADLNAIQLSDIINPKPVAVYEDHTIAEMLQLIKSCSFPILFLPVLKRDGSLAGAVTFNNLIKGEL